jgi:hypothetical protein
MVKMKQLPAGMGALSRFLTFSRLKPQRHIQVKLAENALCFLERRHAPKQFSLILNPGTRSVPVEKASDICRAGPRNWTSFIISCPGSSHRTCGAIHFVDRPFLLLYTCHCPTRIDRKTEWRFFLYLIILCA